MNITPDLVERVARARYDTIHDNDGMPWDNQHASIRQIFTEMSRVWLEAAADAGILTDYSYAYRAQYGFMTLGTYLTRAAAEDHCLRDLHANVDIEDDHIDWLPLVPEDDDTTALNLSAPGKLYDPTGYTVTPIELQTAFDATAES